MQQKLCLWLCVAVLLGALSFGNPFLPATGGASTDASPGASSAGSRRGTEPAPGPAGAVFALDARPRGEPLGARSALSKAIAEPAVVPVSLRTTVPADASGVVCPDVTLRALVDHTEQAADGRTIWVLRDGRRLIRNPDPSGRPLLVPAAEGLQ